MEAIISRQKQIIESIEQINANFKKDSAGRKTPEYLTKKLESLDKLYDDFNFNHDQLQSYSDRSHEYFVKNMYMQLKEFYDSTRHMIARFSNTEERSRKLDRGTQPDQKVLDLIRQQKTNFRAFERMVSNCQISDTSDKWEIEDELRNLQFRWNNIDSIHWQIDNVLEGSDDIYEKQFSHYESMFRDIKKSLNKKLMSSTHLQNTTPQLDIPIFSGNYTQWPTFLDLYRESIHNNNNLSKSQKMQHLKGKLRGEAEKLIQHLHISSENYDTAWNIINQRYNNTQLLFTKQIEIFLNQPTIQKQSSLELKRLHDTSTECINAVRNLGVDTSTWGPLLVHLITKKFDIDTLCDFQEARQSPRELPAFEEVMSFLEMKFTALEPISRKTESSNIKSNYQKPSTSNYIMKNEYTKSYNHNISKPNNNRAYYTGATLSKCIACSFSHALFQCKKFENMTLREKQDVLAKNKVCNNCLYVHEQNVCNSTKRCKICNQAHNTLIHDLFAANHFSHTLPRQQQQLPRNVSHVQNFDDEILLTTVKLQVRARDGTYLTMRGLLDQGSQSTLITENAVQRLTLPRQQFNASISGIGTLSNKIRGKVELNCKSLYEDYEFKTDALIMTKVINNLPSNSFGKKNFVHLQDIQLADPDYNLSHQIDILFDAKVYSDILMDGLRRGLPHQPIAQQTKLGWILSGNLTRTLNCHVVMHDHDDICRFWDMEDIHENDSNHLTESDQYCEDYYRSTTKRLPNGKYEVRLPMKPNFKEHLGQSKNKAVAQFKSLEQKFDRNNLLHSNYSQFMKEYLELGHMKECTSYSNQLSCYLPHHGVQKLDSTTTKLRVVFNASSKTSSGYSLNDLMESGPKLQQDIQELLIQWRSFKYVYSADCEKMYRMFLLHIDDQNLQKIVWRNSRDEILREYQLCTLTYGMKAAPYLAMRTMKQLACDEAANFPQAAKIVENSLYVDNLLSGSNTILEAKQVTKQLIKMFQKAGFNLRQWCSNTPELLKDLTKEQIDPAFIDFRYENSTKTLGLRWDADKDCFQFKNKIDLNIDTQGLTKRDLLSQISKIYDPLGWLSPLTVKAKLLFQRVWLTGISWDDKIPTDLQNDIIDILNDMKNVDLLKIPRWLGCTEKTFELHGFADSSGKAYACVVYLKTKNDIGQTTVTLIAAKTKLSPVNKTVTLPRLELCATLLLTKLINKIKLSLKNNEVQVYGWTDSMIALGWIRGDVTRWKAFVANRVKAIHDIMPASCWNHTRSEDNAADCASRGLTSLQLKNHQLWWEGPAWLKNDNFMIQNPSTEEPQLEIKRCKQTNVLQLIKTPVLNELLNKYSTLTRAVRVLCWVSRFITNLRVSDKDAIKKFNYITTTESKQARRSFIKAVQLEYFNEDISKLKQKAKISMKSNILNLNPFLDQHDILRVGGRLQYADLSYDSKHPILIPHDSVLTKLLIKEAHRATLHGGPSLTLAYIRTNYWIVGGMRVVKKEIRECVVCRRFSSHRHNQLMASLPRSRVTPSRPFTHTGIDFTGFVDIKANKGRGIKLTKGYIAVFVCFSTKAIHLELVSDLSTPTFLAAFKRMCSRRGTPEHVYTDNGTNFVGAARLLRKEYMQAINNSDLLDEMSNMQITWHFNAPLWPSAGGLWEAAVKSTKNHLKRVIGEQKLTYEEFYTLLTQIEACLNSRPLFRLTENIEDGYLTPGHFLIGGPLLSQPATLNENNMNLTSKWQLIEKMYQSFWRKWSTEYLQQLQARHKWNHPTENLKINDIVLVKEDNLPPSKWALAKVHELHPGRDGHVRVVTLKTSNGYTKRPIVKLTPLPVDNQTQIPANDEKEVKPTRRKRNTYKRPNYVVLTLLLLFGLITPSYQETTITHLPKNTTLYFDKIADLSIIQEDWKTILYYNMTTYWQSIDNMRIYITHLKELSLNEKKYTPIINQIEHELTELDHYNDIMTLSNKPTRSKRALFNGIGRITHYLFGVLDDTFAEQYEKDIETIQNNENHLFKLLKNQTSILEAENNILKRNEAIMTKQFSYISEHLKNVSQQINTLNRIIQNFDIIATAFSANIILTNLRRIQETLIDTVTDIYQGEIDTHLLSPSQLQNQLNLIASRIHEELTIPVDDVRDLYRLLRIHARITPKFLIMEVKIPLLYRDNFELDKIISLPWMNKEKSVYNIPASTYIAFNMKKDIFIPLTNEDIQACLNFNEYRMLCHANHPIYNINIEKSLCNSQLNYNSNERYCRATIKPCTDTWIRLHRHSAGGAGAWLFSCCQECTVRILCTGDFTTKLLQGNGVIEVTPGCMIKGDTFSIHPQYNYENRIQLRTKLDDPYYPLQGRSPLNDIINSSVSDTILNNLENHNKMYTKLEEDINLLKSQDIEQIQDKDSHNIAMYTTLFLIILVITGYMVYKVRGRWRRCRLRRGTRGGAAAANDESGGGVDRATSPTFSRTVHFDNLREP